MEDFDLRDLFLEATAEVQAIVREIMEELAEPGERAQALQAWLTAPDEVREQVMKTDPETYRAIMDAMNERK